jgi:splicing factor 3B subunit 1
MWPHHLLCSYSSPTTASCAPCSKRAKPDGASEWDSVEATPAAANRWDATPGSALGGATPGPNTWDATPGAAAAAGGSRWDATPGAGLGGATPAARRNRWDETPAAVSEVVVVVVVL